MGDRKDERAREQQGKTKDDATAKTRTTGKEAERNASKTKGTDSNKATLKDIRGGGA